MTTPEIEELKHLVEEKYGKGINTTTDFEEFSFFLQKNIDRKISASTLKRIWGYVNDEHTPRTATLDTLADYVGHHDFATFKKWLKTSVRYNSSFFEAEQILSSKLDVGREVNIGWSPNRLVRLRYLGDNWYEVAKSQNSKLKAGDKFTSGCFILGQPLVLPFVERKRTQTPPFVAGRNGGLTVLELKVRN